eukprot:CAMPEP_0181101132 /NCGR_PEP_ID=MMETSP1071-20121207/13583_1 /TAXON_ID=35127 /ORGANISM="Thalassiosira sp., Strain NH16" /LENGTH=141 /DNA_ID=CAMNT_0023183947 /DNA_START=31 /DNA_END=456 /DNA_ORIENTATION=+
MPPKTWSLRTTMHPAQRANQDDAGDDGEDDDRNSNPDYEQLKGLWTSELACPELLPHDAETVAKNAEEISNREDAVEELLRRSIQQRGGGGGSRRGIRGGVGGAGVARGADHEDGHRQDALYAGGSDKDEVGQNRESRFAL